MQSKEDILKGLSRGAQQLINNIELAFDHLAPEKLSINHWLYIITERHGAMVEAFVEGIDLASLKRHLLNHIQEQDTNDKLNVEFVVNESLKQAKSRGNDLATERDIVTVVLKAAGYDTVDKYSNGNHPQKNEQNEKLQQKDKFITKAKRPCPMLEKYGRDLTQESAAGKLNLVVGRDDEVQLMIETLCRRTKRNPVLVGPAGVGKTAVVEGLAQRVAAGDIPDIFKGTRVMAIQPSHLVAGANVFGEIEKRMQAIIVEASQEGIILFIDEIHSIVGAGGREGTGDLASLLKPSLARGEIACIAATTSDEYRRFIEADAALERRFQPIYVDELNTDQTLTVVSAIRDDFANLRGIKVSDSTLHNIVHFAGQFMKNRYFPDKAVDLLEQCIANAVLEGKTSVNEKDAEAVVQRMVGMPTSLNERFEVLRTSLSRSQILKDDDIDKLINRLQVTMRGLDLNPARPNAIILMIGDAAINASGLATELAEALLGGPDRLVSIDFGRFTYEHDISSLIGAPPGYVGYKDSLPLDRVSQMIWCVIRCDNIHVCHPNVLRLLTKSLRDGFITDSRGKHIYLSDAVIILTAMIDKKASSSLGFSLNEELDEDITSWLKKTIDSSLLDQIDLIIFETATTNDSGEFAFEKGLLSELTDIYKKRGIDLIFDDSLIEWLVTQRKELMNKRDWEKLADDQLSPLIIPYLSDQSRKEELLLQIKYEKNALSINKIKRRNTNGI